MTNSLTFIPQAAQIILLQQQRQPPVPLQQQRQSSVPNPQPYGSNHPPSSYQSKPVPPMPQYAQHVQQNQAYNNRPSPSATYNSTSQANNYPRYNPTSPPPQTHDFGPPQVQHRRSPPISRPPPTPAPGRSSSADASLFPLFKAVDKTGTGQLSETELRAALVNGDWTAFDPHTLKMMIRMFDTDKSGTIGFEEFW